MNVFLDVWENAYEYTQSHAIRLDMQTTSLLTLLVHFGRDKIAAFFVDDIFKRIFLNEKIWISIHISLNFVPKGSMNNKWALVQMMARRRIGGLVYWRIYPSLGLNELNVLISVLLLIIIRSSYIRQVESVVGMAGNSHCNSPRSYKRTYHDVIGQRPKQRPFHHGMA